jgi:DNA-binding HxlR family transcriptional regulator
MACFPENISIISKYPCVMQDYVDVSDACRIIKSMLDQLSKPRRLKVIEALQYGDQLTFEELKYKTDISTGSLHHHLTALVQAGLIIKTGGRPARYTSSKNLINMLSEISIMINEPKLALQAASFLRAALTDLESDESLGDTVER